MTDVAKAHPEFVGFTNEFETLTLGVGGKAMEPTELFEQGSGDGVRYFQGMKTVQHFGGAATTIVSCSRDEILKLSLVFVTLDAIV